MHICPEVFLSFICVCNFCILLRLHIKTLFSVSKEYLCRMHSKYHEIRGMIKATMNNSLNVHIVFYGKCG